MKKILIILFLCLILIGCQKKDKNITQINTNQTNEENNSLEETNETKIKEIILSSDNSTITDENNFSKLFGNLIKKGQEIYKANAYTKYNLKNDVYFISLEELNKDFNFDITPFKGTDGTKCDKTNSGIYIDVDKKLGNNYIEDTYPIVPILIGCSKEELAENNSKK